MTSQFNEKLSKLQVKNVLIQQLITVTNINLCVPFSVSFGKFTNQFEKYRSGEKISLNGMISTLPLVFRRENFCLADLPPSPANASNVVGSSECASFRKVVTSQFNENLSFKSKTNCDSAIN